MVESTLKRIPVEPRTGQLWLRLRHSRTLAAWWLLFPAVAVLAMVAGWPLYRTWFLSFTDAGLLSLDQAPSWVGWQNYLTVLRDPLWWRAVANTFVFSFLSVSLETVFGLGIALILDQHFPGRGLVRAAVLVPWAIPTVISAKMWAWMYNDIYGVLNYILLKLHAIGAPVAWLSHPSTAMFALVLTDVWKTTPFMALLLLAGLQVIPRDVYESAKLDTGSRLKTFFSITLPLLRPTLTVAVVFRALDALRIFDLVYVLTGTNTNTATMTVYARQRLMEFQEFGTGSAASCLVFVVIGIFTIAYLWLVQKRNAGAAG